MEQARPWIAKGDGRRLTALLTAYLFGLHLVAMVLTILLPTGPAEASADFAPCALHGQAASHADPTNPHAPASKKIMMICPLCALGLGQVMLPNGTGSIAMPASSDLASDVLMPPLAVRAGWSTAPPSPPRGPPPASS